MLAHVSSFQHRSVTGPYIGEPGSVHSGSSRRKKILAVLLTLSLAILFAAGLWLLVLNLGKLSPDDSDAIGTLAPDFSLIDLQGETVNLSGLRGRVVLLDFMATWCGPCRQEISHLTAIWEDQSLKEKIAVISIDIDPSETEDTLRSFLRAYPSASWSWAVDTAHLGVIYHVDAIPKILVIDEEGYIRFTHAGVTGTATLSEEINYLLGL